MAHFLALADNASLFELVDQPTSHYLFTKYHTSLLSISYEIEDSVIEVDEPARLFVGFQKLSFFLPHLDRYREIAKHAESVWIFGMPDIDPPYIPGIEYVLINPDQPLTREWFLVAESPQYFSALVAKDLSGLNLPRSKRMFRGIWTFDPDFVSRVQTHLSQLVGISPMSYTPDQRDYSSQMRHVSRIANDLIKSLEERNAQLMQTQKLREQLLRMLVHDLRNPLTGMMGNVDLIERAMKYDAPPPDILEFVERTRLSGDELSLLINNMLDINRLEAGEFPIHSATVSVVRLLGELREQYLGAAAIRSLTLETLIQDPTLEVLADAQVMKRVLGNLLSNALRHTRSGGVMVRAERRGGYVCLAVQDTGEGIEADDTRHIFDLYYQGRTNRNRGAAGLGLTFCKQAVEAQGGEIWVESEVGQGSVFYINLPSIAA